MHYGETILAKIQKLEKTMIKYSSYTNHLRFSLTIFSLSSQQDFTERTTTKKYNQDPTK